MEQQPPQDWDEAPELSDEVGEPLASGDVELPPNDIAPVAAAPDDGLPDPLSVIAEMLPGGRSTRGKPAIVFVETRLDTGLVAALRDRAPTLVVLSGNAGDGKTAFLAQLTEASGEKYQPGVRNEYDVEITPGRPYRIVLDGSEDAEDRTNDALLDDALNAFRGPVAVANAPRGTLIAINKGRLLRFLQARSASYGYLWDLVRAAFLGEGDLAETPYILVDLNDRSFIGPDYQTSLMVRVLDRLTTWDGWSSCDQCPAQAHCPALANVSVLRAQPDPVDERPAYRLWRVFAAADLDDRVHITARHVVSQLARLVGAGRRCPDVRLEAAGGEPFGPSNYAHNTLFDTRGSRGLGDSSALDEVLATYDPSERDHPTKGRRLHAAVAATKLDLVVPGRREAYLDAEAAALAEARIDVEPVRGTPDYRQRTIALTHSIERKLHLDASSDLAPSFSLDTIDRFLAIARSESPAEALPRLIADLNSALGVESAELTDLLSPRDYTRGLRGRGFAMLIPASQFSVMPGTALGVPYAPTPYLESWPRSLLLRAMDGPPGTEQRVVATLSIPLLLFEILDRAGRGFRPASQTERAYMVRLRAFYRLLSEHQWIKRPSYVLYDNGRVVGGAKVNGSEFTLVRH